MTDRQQLRLQVRERRRILSPAAQQQAALKLAELFCQNSQFMAKQHFALYLSNDGELDTTALIHRLWQAGKQTYLPVLHPFSAGYLLFLEYTADTPLYANRFGIPQPETLCHKIKPVAELDMILTPLVAFDQSGNRLGMGGGFYDRTLAQLPDTHNVSVAGLAHQCQQIPCIPVEAWDQPMPIIITPERIWYF